MKNIEILSEATGYSVTELKGRQSEPLLQPFDCLLAMEKALEQVKNNGVSHHVREKL